MLATGSRYRFLSSSLPLFSQHLSQTLRISLSQWQTTALRRSFYSTSTDAVSAADLQFGQPLHETHPHLLGPGELTRGITALECAQRRSSLARALPPGSVAVLAAADVKYRSGAVFHKFQQEANFFYLTGFDEPEAVAVIARSESGNDHDFHLFVRPKDPKAEIWEGARSGEQAALDVFNADFTGDIYSIRTLLPPLLDGAREIYTDLPTKPSNTSISSLFARFFGGATPSQGNDSFAAMVASKKVKPLKALLNPLRAVKSPAEIAVMRSAGRASGRALSEAMRQRWSTEKDLAAFLAYEFSTRGCDEDAYIPVVAGGANAMAIHYTANNMQFDRSSDADNMVLVDAGGQIGHYVTDITRTWPLGLRFSPAQRDLYEAVLGVQRACVALCHEDAAVSLDRLHEIAESGLRAALRDLGFDVGAGTGSTGGLGVLFPHHVGHYLGLDVHDTPGLSRSDRLKAGNVITIEPGVYVPDDDRWPRHFRGMGVRIEDSVAVQEHGPLTLSTEAVKEVDDIEALLGTGKGWNQEAGEGPLYDKST